MARPEQPDLELRIVPRLRGSAKTYYWEIYALPKMRLVRRKVYNGVITFKMAEELGRKALARLREEGASLPTPGLLRNPRT